MFTDSEKASEFKLIDNQISVTEPTQWGILAWGGPEDGEIINNQLNGEGEAGIVLYGPVSGFQLINNDFSSFNGLFSDVFLHPYSYENLVVARDHTTVWDDGTDNVLQGDVELLNAGLKSTGSGLNKEKTSKYSLQE